MDCFNQNNQIPLLVYSSMKINKLKKIVFEYFEEIFEKL